VDFQHGASFVFRRASEQQAGVYASRDKAGVEKIFTQSRRGAEFFQYASACGSILTARKARPLCKGQFVRFFLCASAALREKSYAALAERSDTAIET
jgi:hypothetical protein